jgi:hypothetical protein
MRGDMSEQRPVYLAAGEHGTLDPARAHPDQPNPVGYTVEPSPLRRHLESLVVRGYPAAMLEAFFAADLQSPHRIHVPRALLAPWCP